VDDAWRYHEETKHTYESVRRSARALDWPNRPHPFKEYVGLEPEGEPAPAWLARLLRWGTGVIRTRGDYSFRTYSSAGALYPVEVYVALPEGLFHFHPGEFALRRLRGEDVRARLVPDAAAAVVLTGILWRTAWKYGERGYRHLFWDAGTMLANLLALAATDGLDPRLRVAFVDDEVNFVVGADPRREAALCLLALGSAEAPPRAEVGPLGHDVRPLSRREQEFPLAGRVHAASSLATAEEVERWRAAAAGGEAPEPEPPWPERLEPVLRRRGSTRDFASGPVPAGDLASILARAFEPIPADAAPLTHLYGIANRVDGLGPGTFRFEPPDGLRLLREGDFRRHAGYLVLEQALGSRAAATMFFMADLDDVLGRLGGRGYRWAQLEAGIRVGRVYLAAVARRLRATATTFYDDETSTFLAPELEPMLAVAVGA
jgi:SagB-type dehydrogenase family enzyme